MNLMQALVDHPPTSKPKCLFIGPMKGPETDTRKQFEDVFERIVEPAATKLGMEAAKALADGPEMITSAIFRKIRHAHVIVADVSGNNTSVGYELAFAHFLAKCTILLVKGEGKIPYDVRDLNTIRFDLDDKRKLNATIDDVIAHIRSFAEKQWVSADNPIFHAAYAPTEVSLASAATNAASPFAEYIGRVGPPSYKSYAAPSQLVGGSLDYLDDTNLFKIPE